MHLTRSYLTLHVRLPKIPGSRGKDTSSNLESTLSFSCKCKIMHEVRLLSTVVPLPASLSHPPLLQMGLLLRSSEIIAMSEHSLQSQAPPWLCQLTASWTSRSFLLRPHSLRRTERTGINYPQYLRPFLRQFSIAEAKQRDFVKWID